MSLTIGSTLAIVASLFGLAFSGWAVLVASSLVFRKKAEISMSLIQHAPGRSIAIGAALSFFAVVLSLVLLGIPVPLIKLIGWVGLLLVMSFASVGAGGLVLLLAERLQSVDPKLRPAVALNRASLYIVASGLVPILGLFLIFPAVIAMGVGTALQALFMQRPLLASNPAGEM